MTGIIKFDEAKTRSHFILELLELAKDNGFIKIANWDQHLTITRQFKEVIEQISHSISNKTFRVVAREGMPFLRKK